MEELLRNYCIPIICCLVVIILILILIVILYWRWLNEQESEINDLKGRLKSKSQGGQTIHTPAKSTRSTQTIGQQNSGKESKATDDANTIRDNQEDSKNESLLEAPVPTCIYHYLQEASGGKFFKLLPTPDKCFFRTWEENGVRKYEFYGNVPKALANINAIFDDVCVIEGKRSGATIIENVSPGTLDSDLRIIHKAKIRLK